MSTVLLNYEVFQTGSRTLASPTTRVAKVADLQNPTGSYRDFTYIILSDLCAGHRLLRSLEFISHFGFCFPSPSPSSSHFDVHSQRK